MVLAAGLAALWNSQALLDWWSLREYQPPTEIAALASATTMTATGQKYFYVSSPELNDKQTFNTNCPNVEARASLILGCYYKRNIFLLRVDRPELGQVTEVTAAHEMLHAAYERLSRSDKEQINNYISAFYPTITDPKFKELIGIYERTEPGELLNELHSLLPTEIRVLSPELENYYQRYFSDRARIVAAFEAYEGVFTSIEARRDSLLAQNESLKAQIDNLEAQQKAAAADADRLSDEISRLRAQGRTVESNALVPAQNAAASRANSLNRQIQSLIVTYNANVATINQLALLENDLVGSLDSSDYQP